MMTQATAHDRQSTPELSPELASNPDYQIVRELGRGGMGVVYLAHNRLLAHDDVLKVMGRHIVEQPGVSDRFLHEMRAVARLRHPNIVSAYTAFRCGEDLVFAMEYVAGLNLAQVVQAKGPIAIRQACNYVLPGGPGPAIRPRGGDGPSRHQARQLDAVAPKRQGDDQAAGFRPLEGRQRAERLPSWGSPLRSILLASAPT